MRRLFGIFALAFALVVVTGCGDQITSPISSDKAPATAPQQGVAAAQHAGDQGNGGKGSVGGHTEGPPPIDGEVCVNAPGFSECDDFDANTAFEIEIPKRYVRNAIFTVTVCDGNGGNCKIGVRERTGEKCEKLPVDGSGMALCQHPEREETHRFNAYWNENSANGGGREGDRGGEQPGS